MEINRSALLPNLLTIGNGICGFAALIRLSKIELGPDGELLGVANFTIAAYLVLLGMVFDVFDGKLARLARSRGSELGAQLDSLCDLITFGLVPAFLVVQFNQGRPSSWVNIVWFFSLAYFLGALLRLARFTVENAPDENAHLAFKGLPTPAAAGCVASLVIFQRYVTKFEAPELEFVVGLGLVSEEHLRATASVVPYALSFLAPILGFVMLSNRLKYDHMGSKLFGRTQSFDFLAYLIFGAVLLAIVPELVLPVAFLGYLVWTPSLILYRSLIRGTKVPREDPSS
ncbi:MAG: CDP-alcohol phosphatidyltransferase family protein [Planctomycetota bacterium]|nr:CDP-alcohol phosphatidyltransferase family protein [Planctomycetota bacterium]